MCRQNPQKIGAYFRPDGLLNMCNLFSITIRSYDQVLRFAELPVNKKMKKSIKVWYDNEKNIS